MPRNDLLIPTANRYDVPEREVRWPRDPLKAERLRLVAKYLRAGYTQPAIVAALKSQLPPSAWPSAATVAKDCKLLVAIYRAEALRDTTAIFAELDQNYKAASEEAYRLYLESQYDRWEPHSVRTVNYYRGAPAHEGGPVDEVREERITRDGRQAQLIERGSHVERSMILANFTKIQDSRRSLHFGLKGAGPTVNVQVNNQQQTVVAGDSSAHLDFAELARIYGEQAKSGRMLVHDQPRDAIEGEAREVVDESMSQQLAAVLDAPTVQSRLDDEEYEDDE